MTLGYHLLALPLKRTGYWAAPLSSLYFNADATLSHSNMRLHLGHSLGVENEYVQMIEDWKKLLLIMLCQRHRPPLTFTIFWLALITSALFLSCCLGWVGFFRLKIHWASIMHYLFKQTPLFKRLQCLPVKKAEQNFFSNQMGRVSGLLRR